MKNRCKGTTFMLYNILFSIKSKNLTPFNQNHPNSGSMDKYWGDWNIKHTFLTNQKNRPFGLENVKQKCDYF